MFTRTKSRITSKLLRDSAGLVFALSVGIALGARPASAQPCYSSTETAHLFPVPDIAWRVGRTIAVSGSSVALGIPDAITGVAVIYSRQNSVWTETARFAAFDSATNDLFGTSVSLDGETLVVGAPAADSPAADAGAVYVYTGAESSWTLQAKLTANDAEAGAAFGSSVEIHGDMIAVGAPRASNPTAVRSGAAYIFTRTGATWTQQARVSAAAPIADERLGASIALSGDSVACLAPGDRSVAGLIRRPTTYVFVRAGSAWTQQARILPSDSIGNEGDDASMTLDGDTLLLGAPRRNMTVNGSLRLNVGTAYVFRRTNQTWSEQARLSQPNNQRFESAYFGSAVVVHDDVAVVGTGLRFDGTLKNAYVFTRAGTTWTRNLTITPSDGFESDAFGSALSLDGNVLGVVAHNDLVPSLDEFVGSAYMFDLTIDSPRVTTAPASTSACIGGSAAFTVTADGRAPLTYQWRRGNTNLTNTPPYSGVNTSTLSIASVTPAVVASDYNVVITNSCGSVTSASAALQLKLRGDANCDGVVNNFDIDAYVAGILNAGSASLPDAYVNAGGTAECWNDRACWGDTNNDGGFNNFDIDAFVQCVLTACP